MHLDSPLYGLPEYERRFVEPFRSATRRALAALVDLCISEGAALLVLAGDLVDGSGRDYKTAVFFCEQMLRLAARGIAVVYVRGNHDAASRLVPIWLMPESVRELAVSAPETYVLDALGIAVHGQSYPERDVFSDLSAGYPPPVEGLFNLGLLHTSAEGRPGHDPYAPCSRRALRARGYQYWALGHVHRREVLCERPWIVYPGNLQGRSLRESGPKGAVVVEIDGDRVVEVRHVALDVVRFGVRRIDLDGVRSLADAEERVFDGFARVPGSSTRTYVARLVVHGDAGIGALLSHAPSRRMRALVRAAELGCPAPLYVEGIWADLDRDLGGTFEIGARLAA